ncbi:DUF427 domain-containing protein [Nocardia sp. NBC_01377]|uniref:DUF427 domain-containing protein n=1 Tax=Nocardia sp. NBC_01377 TaxID=2903595 RepID=UPI003252CB18
MSSPSLQPSAFDERPDYRVDIHRRRNLVTAHLGDRLIAETTRPLLVDEQDHGLVFYFPREDVKVELRPDESVSTRCPFKGQASYWRFDGDGETPLCWSYDDPILQVARLQKHVAFYQDTLHVRLGVATPAVAGYPPKS